MSGIELALILLLLLAGLSVLGERLPWPVPITYAAGGCLISLWSAFPVIRLDPGFFFLLFVPPLLFADGWLMPLRDFWSVRRPVFTLATGLVVALGGLALGFAVSWLVGKLRDLLQRVHGMDPLLETTISLLTPFAAYLAAGPLGVSNILAVVAAGLFAGWRDPLRMDATTRMTTWKVWSLLLFWLNGLAFVLLGLQLPGILVSLDATYSAGQLALFTAAVSGTAILVRLLWFGPGTHLAYRLFRRGLRGESPPPRSWLAVASWAGMRGTITLAAALSIPP